MRRLRAGILLGLLVSSFGFASPPASDSPDHAVAVLCRLSGNATASRKSERRPLRLFDWIPEGEAIEIMPGSSAVLAFTTGSRYEMGSTAKGTVVSDGISGASGPVRALTPVSPLPFLPSLANPLLARSHSGAVRIRGRRVPHLYPRQDSRSLAEQTVLRFGDVPGASSYDISVKDDAGQVAFRSTTRAQSIPLPPNVLKPGRRYSWEVSAGMPGGEAVSASSDFATLDSPTAQARSILEASVRKTGDLASWALLAEIDRRLGLLWEASEELRSATAMAPTDARLKRASATLERQLQTD